MNNFEKDNIYKHTKIRRTTMRFRNGYKAVKQDRRKQALILFVLFMTIVLWFTRSRAFGYSEMTMISGMVDDLTKIGLIVTSVLIIALLVLVFGTPLCAQQVENDLARAGLTNHCGEPPMVVSVKNQGDYTIYEFDTYGVPLSDFLDKQTEIENALNLFISKIKEGRDNRRIIMCTVDSANRLTENLVWNDSRIYWEKKNSGLIIVLGESVTGEVSVDLGKVPHLLLGGSTGSGKTILLKCILWQCIVKRCEVIIADFKGGADFPQSAWSNCTMVYDEESLKLELKALVSELERRKAVFRANECSNIDEYNNNTGDNLRRIIFACDEVAELLDTSGLSKEHKASIEEISGYIATIARQGRAFGINLVLATQRPDATVLPGQIKNNIDFRACGRADKVLSRIILDDDSAAEKISKDAQGRFLTNDGTLFQAYMFDDRRRSL